MNVAQSRGMLAGTAALLMVIGLTGCPGDDAGGRRADTGQTDAGRDTAPADVEPAKPLQVDYVAAVDDGYEALEDDEGTLEIIAGFQGGFHVEPTLRVENLPAGFVVVEQTLTDVLTGEVLTSAPIQNRLERADFEVSPSGGWVDNSTQVIMDIVSPCDVVGKRVRLDVEVRSEDDAREASDSVVVSLVNERREITGEASESCPPGLRKPPLFYRPCTDHMECGQYLVCAQPESGAETECGWPAAMSGQPGPESRDMSVTRDGADIAEFSVEVAADDFARSRALTHRPCLQSGWGLLIEYPDVSVREISLESMCFAIDIAFLDAEGTVISIHADSPPNRPEPVVSEEPAAAILQLRAGAFEQLGVQVGDAVEYK